MNYIKYLEKKKEQLKTEIADKEKNLLKYYNTILNDSEEDIIGRITEKLSLITTFGEGARIGLSILKYFKQ